MSNSIHDILQKHSVQEPPEIGIVKAFVAERFDIVPRVSISGSRIIIEVRSAALAGSLRLQLFELQKLVGSDYKLTIRIS